jgi:hypothetical protein
MGAKNQTGTQATGGDATAAAGAAAALRRSRTARRSMISAVARTPDLPASAIPV